LTYLSYRFHKNEVIDFTSDRYTITDLQAPETRQYIPRGRKWSDVKNVHFSSLKMSKKKSAKAQKSTRFLNSTCRN